MSVSKVNGWSWRCSWCHTQGFERLKKDAVTAESRHDLMHRPAANVVTFTLPYSTTTTNGWAQCG